MIMLSELKMKEVILIKSGKRLGFIDDLVINPDTGQIISFIIMDRDLKSVFLKRSDEKIIDWEYIVTIGKDTILVSDDIEATVEVGVKRNTKNE